MANLKVLNKKILTKIEGVFYKEIINENNKVIDKIFFIRYKQKTIGKFSEEIRLEFCKAKRIEILNKIKHGEYYNTPIF